MTITRETFPDGSWADLRDVADVPERLRRPVRTLQMLLSKDEAFTGVVDKAKSQGVEALKDIDEAQAVGMAQSMGEESFQRLQDLTDCVIVSRVVGWSFGPEVTRDALLDLPGSVYDRLQELTAAGALEGGPNFAPSQDPASPTVPSTA